LDHEKEKKEWTGGQSASQSSAKQVDALKAELEESENKAKSIQTELDDLLLVLGDLEEKQSRYRDKIKSLGGEVTEDEEDDEE
jgi:intracellular protein transport protein USO1